MPCSLSWWLNNITVTAVKNLSALNSRAQSSLTKSKTWSYKIETTDSDKQESVATIADTNTVMRHNSNVFGTISHNRSANRWADNGSLYLSLKCSTRFQIDKLANVDIFYISQQEVRLKIKLRLSFGLSSTFCLRFWTSITSYLVFIRSQGGSVAEWLACWTQAQKGPGSNRSHDAVG